MSITTEFEEFFAKAKERMDAALGDTEKGFKEIAEDAKVDFEILRKRADEEILAMRRELATFLEKMSQKARPAEAPEAAPATERPVAETETAAPTSGGD